MDVTNKLVNQLVKSAADVARDHDYMASCGNSFFCDNVSMYFAYTLPDTCTDSVRRHIENKFKDLPDCKIPSTTTTDCTIQIAVDPDTVTCEAITIKDDANKTILINSQATATTSLNLKKYNIFVGIGLGTSSASGICTKKVSLSATTSAAGTTKTELSLKSNTKFISSVTATGTSTGTLKSTHILSTSVSGVATSTTTLASIAFLDKYPRAAVAFSLRKINSTYTGPAIRVRRSQGNDEIDVYFTPDGSLDEQAIINFGGTGSVFVSKWYDQSGNFRHAESTDIQYQPLIYNGTISYKDNRPAILFDGYKFLEVPNTRATFEFMKSGNKATVLSVFHTNLSYGGIVGNSESSTGFSLYIPSAYEPVIRGNYDGEVLYFGLGGPFAVGRSGQVNKTSMVVAEVDPLNAVADQRTTMHVNNKAPLKNNTYLGVTAPRDSDYNLTIGVTAGFNLIGTLKEVVIWDTLVSTTSVKSEVNDYYNIY